jgi:hypothetical protein
VKTPPEWWPAVENILTEYGLDAISFVADFKKASGDYPAQIKQDISAPQAQQGEPVAELIRGEGGSFRVAPNMDALKAIYALPAGTHKLYAGAAPAPQAQQEPVAECVDDREGIDDVDRELLSKVSKALAYYSNGDPIRDFIDTDDMVAAMQLLMRVVPDGDRLEAVASFVAGYRTGYEAEPPKHMTDAAGGMK